MLSREEYEAVIESFLMEMSALCLAQSDARLPGPAWSTVGPAPPLNLQLG
jgi:hypothetical protein